MACKTLTALLLTLASASGTPLADSSMLEMKPRRRSMHWELRRVLNYHSTLGVQTDIIGSALRELDASADSPETQVIDWAFPDTLDYTVELSVCGGTACDSADSYNTYPVIVDTGSSNFAIASKDCLNCGEATSSLGFEEADTSNCIYVKYGSGEWFGTEASGSVGFPTGCSSELPAFVTSTKLAAIAVQKDFFVNTNASDTFDGILGLGYPALADPYSPMECMMDSREDKQGEELTVSERSAETYDHLGPLGGPENGEETNTAAYGYGYTYASGSYDETPAIPLLYTMLESGAISRNLFGLTFCGTQGGTSTMTFSKGLEAQGLTQESEDSRAHFVPTLQTVVSSKDPYWGYFLVNLNKIMTLHSKTSGKTFEQLIKEEKLPTELTLGVSGKDMNGEVNGHLVDSGTTLLYVTTVVYTLLQEDVRVKTMTCLSATNITGPENWQKIFKMTAALTEDVIECMPTIVMQLGANETTYDLELSPTKYMLKWPTSESGVYEYYWAVQKSNVPIIGNVAMNGKTVVFDSTDNSSYAIGFADHACDTAETIMRCAEDADLRSARASSAGVSSMRAIPNSAGSSVAALDAKTGPTLGTSVMLVAMALAVFGAFGERRRRRERLESKGYFPLA